MTKFTTLDTHIGDRPSAPYVPGETREVDDPAQVKHLVDGGTLGEYDAKAEKAFLDKQKAAARAPADTGPDYERDSLKDVDLHKASKDVLLVIAAYEKVDLPQGDGATKEQIAKAIEAKRKAA
jgi:hypothetical protein